MIDIVAKSSCLARGKYRPLSGETVIIPIFLKSELLRYFHSENHMASELQLGTSAANNQVSDGCATPNIRLTASNRASAEEGIGCKTIVPTDFI
jgi:hypothetical protein